MKSDKTAGVEPKVADQNVSCPNDILSKVFVFESYKLYKTEKFIEKLYC